MTLPTFKVGVTGSRYHIPDQQHAELKSRLWMLHGGCGPRVDPWLLHGDCSGADSLAHDIAKAMGYFIHVYPPKIDTFRAFKVGFDLIEKPDAYYARNRAIAEECDVLVAVPKKPESQDLRSGTWQTVRMARQLGKKVYIIKGGQW